MSREFDERNAEMINRMGKDEELRTLTRQWFAESSKYEYSYHFKWLGRPVIQFPQDLLAMQEIVWQTKPDLIIETGIARGGSLIFFASLLELLGGKRTVLGIDVDIRSPNRKEIESHVLAKRIVMLEGSSTDKDLVDRVHSIAKDHTTILVVLDSNHTYAHVRDELKLYSPLVSVNSYMIVCDTVIHNMPESFSADRAWGPNDNPYLAVKEFLKTNDSFVVDQEIENKLLITVAPGGYLKRIKE